MLSEDKTGLKKSIPTQDAHIGIFEEAIVVILNKKNIIIKLNHSDKIVVFSILHKMTVLVEIFIEIYKMNVFPRIIHQYFLGFDGQVHGIHSIQTFKKD